VLKGLHNCIQLCVRITAECNTWKMFDFIFRNNIPWGWSHKMSRNKTSNKVYSVRSLWRILLSRVHVLSSTQGYIRTSSGLLFSQSAWNERPMGRLFQAAFLFPPLNSQTTKLIRKDLAFDGVQNKCNVGDLRIPPRCKLDLRSFGISRSVEW